MGIIIPARTRIVEKVDGVYHALGVGEGLSQREPDISRF